MVSRILMPMLLLLALAACNREAYPVPLNDALSHVESDLAAAGTISFGDVTNDPNLAEFKANIAKTQCQFGRKDPIVPVFTAAFTLALQGTFSQNGTFSVTGVPTTPGIGASYAVTSGQQQTLTVPITFASLSSLPLLYANQQATFLAALPSFPLKKPTDPVVPGSKESEGLKLEALKNNMQAAIDQQISGFDASKCPSPPGGNQVGPYDPLIYKGFNFKLQ